MPLYIRRMTATIRCFAVAQLVMCAPVLHAQSPELIGYWHNWNDANAPYFHLDQVDPRYTIINLAFAEPVGGSTYAMEFVPSLDLPNDFRDRVDTLRAHGKKVLASIGGANATVQLNSEQEKQTFIYLMNTLLQTWNLDGVDIDLEGASVATTGGTIAAPVDSSIIRFISAMQEVMVDYRQATGNKMFLTMAPETAYVQGGQSAFGGIWGAYLPIIDALRDSLDILHVQLYNSGSMYGIDAGIYNQGTADFIVSQTEAVIQGFNTSGGFFVGLPPEKVAVGLPACSAAAGGGYVDTATVRVAMEYLLGEGPQPGIYTLQQPAGYPSLRGMMTWSINWDAVSNCNGTYSYADTYERVFGDFSTGVPVVEEEEMLLIGNPVRDVLRFNKPMNGVLRVRDSSGRLVQSTAMNGNELDVRHLPCGLYLVELSGGNRILRARFVKE